MTVNGHSTALSGPSFLGNHIPSLTCRRPIPSLTPDRFISKYSCYFSVYNGIVAFFLMIILALLLKFWYLLLQVQSHIDHISFNMVYIFLQLKVKTSLGSSSLYLKVILIFIFIIWGYIVVTAHSFFGSSCTPLDITSLKNGIFLHLK